MQRRSFLVTVAASFAITRVGGGIALAAVARDRKRIASVAVRRQSAEAGIPGGCANHRRRSASGYDLAYALSGLSLG